MTVLNSVTAVPSAGGLFRNNQNIPRYIYCRWKHVYYPTGNFHQVFFACTRSKMAKGVTDLRVKTRVCVCVIVNGYANIHQLTNRGAAASTNGANLPQQQQHRLRYRYSTGSSARLFRDSHGACVYIRASAPARRMTSLYEERE